MKKPRTIGAYRLHEPGGPEAMRWERMALQPPSGAQVLVRHTAVGLNYIDAYHRSGLYPLPLPSRLGVEAAGVVEAVGPDADVEVGERVAYAGPLGAYGRPTWWRRSGWSECRAASATNWRRPACSRA